MQYLGWGFKYYKRYFFFGGALFLSFLFDFHQLEGKREVD